jgi:hypothetical protein
MYKGRAPRLTYAGVRITKTTSQLFVPPYTSNVGLETTWKECLQAVSVGYECSNARYPVRVFVWELWLVVRPYIEMDYSVFCMLCQFPKCKGYISI